MSDSNLILDTVMRKRIELEKHYAELSLDAEMALGVRDLIDESGSLRLLYRYEARLQRNLATTEKMLQDAQRNRPPVQDGPEAAVESTNYTEPESAMAEPPNETIPTTEHLAPIGKATKPHTILPIPQQNRDGNGAAAHLQPAVMVATATSPLPLITNHQPLTTATDN